LHNRRRRLGPRGATGEQDKRSEDEAAHGWTMPVLPGGGKVADG
jgi:hypothetical protein